MILVAYLYFVGTVPYYTDDLKNVPAAYAASVQTVEIGTLADYERFTPDYTQN
jgi:hypothetical protein